MIGFGELRRLSIQWQVDLAAVERVYALDWLLKGIFEREALCKALSLRGPAALGKAYFQDYPPLEDADLARAGLSEDLFQAELAEAARSAANSSGVGYDLRHLAPSQARFEYTGPLGRRSAAQPHITLRFLAARPRLPAVERPLLHPFSDNMTVTVRAAALDELAAEGIAALSYRPRARDLYDLWFLLTRGASQIDPDRVRSLALQISAEKRRPLRTVLDAEYRPIAERGWKNALNSLRGAPEFSRAEAEIARKIAELGFTA